MESITLSWYIRTIRLHSKNRGKSYQTILGDLFEIIFQNSDYPVGSSTSSRIMNGEFDVPYNVREKYNEQSREGKKEISDVFIGRMIDASSMDGLIDEMKKRVQSSKISEQIKNEILIETNALEVLATVLSIAIISSNKRTLDKKLYESVNGSIALIDGDLIAIGFNKRMATSERIVVIPVDDKFTMVLENQNGEAIISKDTIHGKWILRMRKLGIERPSINYSHASKSAKIGKCKVGNTEFYLLPVSSLKQRYEAKSEKDVIKRAAYLLAREYSVSGQGVPIYVPLIGTGRSRAHLSLRESLFVIKEAFLGSEDGFFGNVKIVVQRKDIDELEGA